MTRPIAAAISAWGLEGCPAQIIATRENVVYRVDRPGAEPVVLRFHRPGLRTGAELLSELSMMDCLSAAGLRVPRPVPSQAGHLLVEVDGHHADVLSWVAGRAISDLTGPGRLDAFHTLGWLAARMHDVLDDWAPPAGFVRHSWDRAGLLGENPVWGRFWEHPALSRRGADVIRRARDAADTALSGLEATLDQGLIHADMVGENVLVDEDGPTLIDFDDAGYGFRLFELATILQHQLEARDYREVRNAVLDGYTAVRGLDLSALDLMLLLRSFTYLGWIIPRMTEPDGPARSDRFVARCTRRARQWLDGNALT